MDPSHYLAQGTQTQFTERVYEHADKARSMVMHDPEITPLSEPLLSIYKTCKYLSTLEGINATIPKDRIFRKRTLDQILKEGYYPTCSDIGLLFRGLMAAQGHPTAYVEAFHEAFLLDLRPRKSEIMGHVFGRVFHGDTSLIVDPLPNPIIVHSEMDIFPHVIFREGLDSWDIGIYEYEDMRKLKDEHIEALLARYEQNLKADFQRKIETLQAARQKSKYG